MFVYTMYIHGWDIYIYIHVLRQWQTKLHQIDNWIFALNFPEAESVNIKMKCRNEHHQRQPYGPGHTHTHSYTHIHTVEINGPRKKNNSGS